MSSFPRHESGPQPPAAQAYPVFAISFGVAGIQWEVQGQLSSHGCKEWDTPSCAKILVERGIL